MQAAQYGLAAFFYHENDMAKILTLESLETNSCKNGTMGKAIIQEKYGPKVVVAGVKLERVETRILSRNTHYAYVVVIKAIDSQSVKISHDSPILEYALKQLKEVYLLWKHVPWHHMHCHNCLTLIPPNAPALFENETPVCSPYCTVFPH